MSLWKRGNQYWADFSVEGERFRTPLGTTDWREATRLERQAIDEARQGKRSPKTPSLGRMKLAEAVPVYLAAKHGRIAEGSMTIERERLHAVARHIGSMALHKVTATVVNDYVTQRQAEKVSNRTINMELEVLRRLLKMAKLWHRVADDVKPLRQNSEVARALTDTEKARLIAAARGKPEWENARLAMMLSLNTTMRKSEVRGLRWEHVDFLARTVTVRRSKTPTGQRVIPLNSEAWSAILELRERAKLLFGDDLKPEWYLFPHCPGLRDFDPSSPIKGWRTAWRKLTRAAGLKG
jgi:integrase